jgi:glycosyltransferase involved in cell wall biosynthesis
LKLSAATEIHLKTAMKLLTIGIPTYNNGHHLGQAIEAITSQLASLDEVEILICDNASSDNTEAIVSQYAKKFPHTIRYIKQGTNVGMDRNFWSVIKNATGKFVHLHGSDDHYIADGVGRVLDVARSNHLDAILLSNNYLNTHNNLYLNNREDSNKDIHIKNNGSDFFLKENLKVLCLSNVIVNRLRCSEIADIESYFGCQWLHIALLTNIINPTSSAYIFNFSRPVMTVRIGDQQWLENEGAIDYYYKALLIFHGLRNRGHDRKIFEHVKRLFMPLISGGGTVNFKSPVNNILYSLKFFKFYYNMPVAYANFCLKLILKKHRPFFDGWEKLGEK